MHGDETSNVSSHEDSHSGSCTEEIHRSQLADPFSGLHCVVGRLLIHAQTKGCKRVGILCSSQSAGHLEAGLQPGMKRAHEVVNGE